jgi:hypothetical protein
LIGLLFCNSQARALSLSWSMVGPQNVFTQFNAEKHQLFYAAFIGKTATVFRSLTFSEKVVCTVCRSLLCFNAMLNKMIRRIWKGTCRCVGRNSSVGTATHYATGWTVRESNSGGGEIFRTVQTGPVAYPLSFTMSTGSFIGVKQPGRGVDHQPRSIAEVKEVELFLYTPPPSGPSWPGLGWTLRFTFPCLCT